MLLYHLRHFLMTGVYMYLESTGANEGDTCVLFTTRYQKEIAPCTLNFYYYMQGSHIGSLHVHLVTEPGVLGNNLWSMVGANGNTWREANIDLTNVTGPYSVKYFAFCLYQDVRNRLIVFKFYIYTTNYLVLSKILLVCSDP